MSDPHDRKPVDQATIDGWRVNYGLNKRTPAEAAKWWGDNLRGLAPSGCVAALGVALDDMDLLRKDADRYRWLRANMMGVIHLIGRPGIGFSGVTGDGLDAQVDAAMGLKRKEVYVHDDDWPELLKLARRLERRRAKLLASGAG